MTTTPIVLWLRQDLRLSDNEALSAAAASGRPVIPLYIHDDAGEGAWRRGGASRWWLHRSLERMAASLETLGSRLVLARGDGARVLDAILEEAGATDVIVSRRYTPAARQQDEEIGAALAAGGIGFEVFCGALLHDPETLRTGDGNPYKVFTPFWRKLQEFSAPPPPIRAPKSLKAPDRWPKSVALETLDLLPTRPDWAGGLRAAWQPGEAGARERLRTFLAKAVDGYGVERDFPGRDGTSKLSAHLHFGEISPRACWHAALACGARRPSAARGEAAFRRELAWRDFSYHLLFHWPDLPSAPFRPAFSAYPWRDDAAALKRWQRGVTGYPIVDAGMRQLWHTGWMHNRVRMIVASFLIKHLRLHWRDGEAWFWDTLVDADLANNAASWQWVAGSGADAAPYFRIFNPMTQGQKFDRDGDYVKAWVPELAGLSPTHVHAPWQAPGPALAAAGIVLGKTYPEPMVDHDQARRAALEGYAEVKASAE